MNRLTLRQLIAAMAALGFFNPPVKVDPPAPQTSRPVLTARDQGMYVGVPWRASERDPLPAGFFDRTKDFRFAFGKIANNVSISPEQLDKSINAVNALLAAAEKPETKRAMIVQIYFWDGDERYRGTGADPDPSKYKKRLDDVLSRLNVSSPALVGITLGEENVPNSGRAKILDDLYRQAKARFPELPVYQWYSGNLLVPARHEGIFVGADGWIINPYTLTRENAPDSKLGWGDDPYLRLVQKYVVTRKPVISVLWAADDRPFYFDRNDPKNKDRIDMWEIMNHQLDVNFAFNLPSGYYNLRGVNGRLTPYYSLTEAQENPLLEKITGFLGDANRRAASLPSNFNGQEEKADRWTGSTLNGGFLEMFASSDFIQKSSGTGFRDLYWNGSALGFAGYQGRPVNASITYRFANSQNRRLEVDIRSLNGGKVELTVGGSRQSFSRTGSASVSGNASEVTVRVTGPAGSLSNPTAILGSITVDR